jgi:carbon storage regulator
MLVVRRRQGEVIRIGGDVELRLLSIGKSSVRLGIDAPRSVVVTIGEPGTEISDHETSEKTPVGGRCAEMSGEL